MHSTVEQFLQLTKRERGFSANTISAYRNDLVQFITYLQAPPVFDHLTSVNQWPELTGQQLSMYLLHLKDREYAPSTVARKTAAIKSFCHFLTKMSVMRADLALDMATPRVEKFVPRTMTVDEIDRLLAEPEKEKNGQRPETIRDTAMLEALYSTGMRVSELVALNIDDVDLERGSVRCNGKNGRERQVPLRQSAVAAVERYFDEARPAIVFSDEQALFVNHRGTRLTRQGFWLILKAHADRAEIDDVTPQTLRHSFAAHALKDGLDLRDVQQMLGHVSISTTQVYRRLAGEGNLAEPTGDRSIPGEAS